MNKHTFLDSLYFEDTLVSLEEISAEYSELALIGADKCYISNGKPAMFFMEVHDFGPVDMRRIADVLHKAWNYRKVILLMVCGDVEVRVYNCYSKPIYFSDENKINLDNAQLCSIGYNDDSEKIQTFAEHFSRLAIDNGCIWVSDDTFIKKINLKDSVDAYLVNCLKETTNVLTQKGLDVELVHALLLRSLFILFLEDKGAANEAGLYENILPGAKSYFDILKNKSATYRLFHEVNLHFNGNITPLIAGEDDSVNEEHLEVVRRCFLDGDLVGQEKLFGEWRLFKFDVIQIQLLSEIYEHFLSKSMKKERGQYYTPANLVDLILSEKLPINKDTLIKPILDPTCGSGIFLVEAYKRLVRIWRLQHDGVTPDFNILRDILLDNIYGIEIDETAIKVAAFSLYLALIDELDPKTLWINDDYRLPYLIHCGKEDAMHQGKNLWCMDATTPSCDFSLPKIGLLVGNPPFGTKIESQSIRQYLDAKGFAKEMVLAFMHLATCLCPDGEIALVCNFKIFTNTNAKYQKFRKWLLQETYVEKIYNFSIFRHAPNNFGGSLFSTAVAPVAVVFYTANIPREPSSRLIYWAPKTFVKSNVVDGIVIDNTDLKYLPRVLCQDPKTIIWKLGMWGNFNVLHLLQKLGHISSLGDSLIQDSWIVGKGMNCDSKHPDVKPQYLVKLESLDNYYTDEQALINNNKCYRRTQEGMFDIPFVLLKESSRSTGMVCCLYGGKGLSTTSTFVFNHPDKKKKIILTAYLNSKLANSILFLTSSTWGIERDRLQKDEILSLPSPFGVLNTEQEEKLVECFNELVKLKQQVLSLNISSLRDKIDELFYDAFGLTESDRVLIEDSIKYDLDLFYKGKKSVALKCARDKDVVEYAECLCKELNAYLSDSRLSVSIKVYEGIPSDILRIIVMKFGKEHFVEKAKAGNLHGVLKKLSKILLESKHAPFYVQKILKFYDEDTVTIVKPNSNRYWTRSQAMDDASVILSDIINMKEDDNA